LSSYRRASVVKVRSWGPGIQEAMLEFPDGSQGPALVLEDIIGPVETGDELIANTTAVELGLGSGGYHFVVWNLSRDNIVHESAGHIMKLRYTPLQFNVMSVEEQMSPGHDEFVDVAGALEGVPVVAGSLHSQLLPVAVSFRHVKPDGRLVYVMTDGGSLPIKLSHTVRFLKENGYLEATITCGQAFGGDYEAVNIYGAMVAARRVCGADAVVALMGPGIVGTGTAIGFSGMEQGVVLNAAGSLSGTPIAVPRITFADRRGRHNGLSHHTISALLYGACVEALVALPLMQGNKRDLVWDQLKKAGIDTGHSIQEIDAEDALRLIKECGYDATVMGRSVDEEPEFFMAAAAAGILAASMSGG